MNTNIIYNLRYLIYNFLGFISFILRRITLFLYIIFTKNSKINNKIAVCGRGVSSNKFFNNEYKIHNKVYLSNYSNEDLNLTDYIKLIGKNIVIVANVSEPTPNIILFFLIKVNEVIISRPSHLVRRTKKERSRKSFKLNLLGVKVRGISNATDIDKYPCTLDNTGILSIYEAAIYASENSINKIYLYGFEFYSSNYNKNNLLRNDFISDEQFKEHQNDNYRLSKNLDYLASLYPKILFINNSLNKYKFKSKNIKTIYSQ